MLRDRASFALVSLRGRIFAVGGSGKSSVECYDPLKMKWELVRSMNCIRKGHSVVAHRDHLFAIGGNFLAPVKNSIEYYDPIIDKWTLVIAIDKSDYS